MLTIGAYRVDFHCLTFGVFAAIIRGRTASRRDRRRSTVSEGPLGEEREVKFLGGTAIDGAPVAYIVVLAAVVTGLAFVPLSAVIGSGKSFPMSQAIYPLIGWILGPIAGAIANAIGALIGVLVAPHTTTVPAATVLGALMGGLSAGSMALGGSRKRWWMGVGALGLLVYATYAGRAVLQNGVSVGAVVLGSFIDWSALLLFLLPTRKLAARWIGGQDLSKLAAGLFLGTWMVAGLTHLLSSTIVYYVLNWPAPVWAAMAPVAPIEHAVRSIVGTVIGTGVIAGLRAIGLVKPKHSVY
jgi:hypothetical protein